MKARSTCGVCFGIDPSHIRPLIDKLRKSQNRANHPELVPLCVLDMAITRLRTFCDEAYANFLSIRDATSPNLYDSPVRDSQPPDLTHMPQKLASLIDTAADNTSAIQGTSNIIQYLETKLETMQPPDEVVVEMKTHLVFLRQTLEATRRKNDCLKESVQGTMRMVSRK